MEEYTRTAGNPAQSYCFKEMRHCPACDSHGNCTLTACTYHQPSDEGRFPDEAEREYRKNFEAKCKKTGVNIIAEPDADVAEAIDDVESVKGYLNDVCNHQSVRTYDSLYLAITALRQMRRWIPVADKPPKPYMLYNLSFFGGQAVGTGMIDDDGEWWAAAGNKIPEAPDAYMPLPEPWKGE